MPNMQHKAYLLVPMVTMVEGDPGNIHQVPGERDRLESLRGLVDLLGVELAGVAGLDDFGGILKH